MNMFSEEVMLETHLQYNHYPSALYMLPYAKQAIELCKQGKPTEEVIFPSGQGMPAFKIVDDFHLDGFIPRQDDEEYLDGSFEE